jgi:hypothetical protein
MNRISLPSGPQIEYQNQLKARKTQCLRAFLLLHLLKRAHKYPGFGVRIRAF